MKKSLIIFLIIILFITLNFSNLSSFYNDFMGKISYEKDDFKNAKNYFQKSGNKKSIYNIGLSLYKEGKFKEVANLYENLLTKQKNELNFYINSVLGDVFYRIGEKEDAIKNWEKSIDFYKESLKINYDEKVEKNLEFVLDKLNKQKEKEREKKEQEKSKENEENKENGNKKEQNKNSGDDSSKEKENSTKVGDGEENKSNQDKSSQNGNNTKEQYNLTKEAKEQLKLYEEALKKSEKQNMDSFGKIYKENNSFSEFEDMFNNPFFDNSIMDKNSNVKDW